MSDSKKKDNNISIELDEKISEGIFSNLAFINHSSSEFIVDFIQMLPGMPKGKVKSRIILSPEHTKKLLRALNDNVVKYEKKFGDIKEFQRESKEDIVHFGNILGEA